MPRVFVVSVLLLVLAGCAGSRRAPEEEGYTFDRAAESKLVYEAVLQHMWLGDRVENVVLDPMTSGSSVEAYNLRQEFRGLRADTMRDYLAKADQTQRLPTDLNVGRPIHWYTHAEFEKNLQAAQARNEGLPLETAWEMVRTRWPNWSGWLSLGEVGFSADGTQALVDTGAGFAGLSASWHVVLLVKRNGTWQVVREFESARA